MEEVVGGGECFQEIQGSRASPNCRGPDYSLLGGPTTRGHPGSHVLSLQSVLNQGVVERQVLSLIIILDIIVIITRSGLIFLSGCGSRVG